VTECHPHDTGSSHAETYESLVLLI